MADGPSQLNKYTRISESQVRVVNQRVSGQNSNQANAPAQQAPEEEYELDKKAIGICAGISLAVVLLFIWLLFRSGDDAISPPHGGPKEIAIELLNFSRLQNFSNYDDKKQFIESQLDDRLTRYNGSLGVSESSAADYWKLSSSDLKEFKDLYTAFLKNYNQFIEISKDSKGFYDTMKAISSRYNKLKEEIQAEKINVLDLLKKEENLTETKKSTDFEIELLKIRQKNLLAKLEELKSQLKREFPNVDEKALEAQRKDCDDLKKKIANYLEKLKKLQRELDEAYPRLKEYQDGIDSLAQQIEDILRQIRALEKQKSISELDLKTSREIEGFAVDIEKHENARANTIRERLTNVLQLLKEKFELLKRYGDRDDDEKDFFYNTTKVLKHHVQLLVKTKHLIKQEKGLAKDGKSSHKASYDIEKEIKIIIDKLKALYKQLEDLRNQKSEKERKWQELDEIVKNKQNEADIIQRNLDQASNSLKACLEELELLEATLTEFIRRTKELLDPVKSELEEVARNLTKLSETRDAQEAAIKLAHRNIMNLEKKINIVVKDLADNYQRLTNEKYTHDKKEGSLLDILTQLELSKRKLIEFLTRIGEPPKQVN